MGHALVSGRRVRGALAVLLALGAGAAMWARAAPIEPHLEVRAARSYSTDSFHLWSITVLARGGETIPDVRLEIVSGPVHFVRSPTHLGLPPGFAHEFYVQMPRTPAEPEPRGLVRVVQGGPGRRTYDVPLGESP